MKTAVPERALALAQALAQAQAQGSNGMKRAPTVISCRVRCFLFGV
jgi:hypothetical protein